MAAADSIPLLRTRSAELYRSVSTRSSSRVIGGSRFNHLFVGRLSCDSAAGTKMNPLPLAEPAYLSLASLIGTACSPFAIADRKCPVPAAGGASQLSR